jgi:hypothetical protein
VDTPLYVLTSDKYVDALRPFSWLLAKYWLPAPTVIVGGFTPPTFDLPRNFAFHSIGKQEDYPVGKWSNALVKMLLELPHDVFGLMLEDYWLTRPVDAGAVGILADYMRQFEYVARLDLTGDRLHSGFAKPYGKVAHINLIASDPESQYHCSLMCALWRRAHMLKFLVEGETPWEVELNGTSRLRALKNHLLVLGTDNPPVNHTLAFRGGEPGKVLVDELNPYDVAEMKNLGLLRKWGIG